MINLLLLFCRIWVIADKEKDSLEGVWEKHICSYITWLMENSSLNLVYWTDSASRPTEIQDEYRKREREKKKKEKEESQLKKSSWLILLTVFFLLKVHHFLFPVILLLCIYFLSEFISMDQRNNGKWFYLIYPLLLFIINYVETRIMVIW